MSLRNWPVLQYGVLVQNGELDLAAIAKEYNSQHQGENIDDGDVAEWIDTEQLPVGDGGYVMTRATYSDDMEGYFYNIFTNDEVNINVPYDSWALLDLPKYPSFFEAVAKDKNDLIRQVKALYAPYLKDAEHFDWEGRLVRLEAVIYG